MKTVISEELSADFAEPGRHLSDEIASRDKSIDFIGLTYYLPDPDPVLRNQGSDIRIYKDLLSDAHLWSCIQSRKAGVLSLEWEIDRGKAKSRQAKIIQKLFEELNIEDIITEILDTPLFGYNVIEIIWSDPNSDGLILPVSLKAKPAEWFRFDDKNELLFLTRDNPAGMPLSQYKYKFLVPQFNPSYQNPYGQRVLSKCFWPVTFKKGGLKFWVTFAEKYGMPFLLGKYAKGTSADEKNNMLNMLANMIQDAVAIIPIDAEVAPVEASGKTASSQIFNDLISFCNTEISKAVLGQTLTTEMGSTGSFAASKTHMQVRKEIVDWDKRLVQSTLNRLIRYVYEINFGQSNDIPKFYMYEEEEVDLNLAGRDKILKETGVSFTKEYYIKAYGFEEDDIDLVTPVLPAGSDSPVSGPSPVLASLNLNGAQIASAVEIVQNVSSGDIPRESGISQLMVFLGLNKDQAEAVMGSAGTGKIIKADKVVSGTKGSVQDKVKQPAPQFAENPEDTQLSGIQKLADIIPDKLLQLQIEQTMKPVIDLVNKSQNYSEVMDNLSVLYPKMKTEQLQQLLEKAIFVSEIWGRVNG